MTNSEVLQFIISKLKDSSLEWKGDKELFELIFAPISYGNEIEIRRKAVKQQIIYIFQDSKEFDKTKFTKLANNITCGENENIYRREALEFIQSELKRLDILPNVDIGKLVDDIPCKDNKEKNYRSHFSNWKKNDTSIHDKNIKNRVEKNFDFQNKLWSRGDTFIKQTLEKGIERFIKQHTQKNIVNIFVKIRDEFDLIDDITEDGLNDLQLIPHMDRQEIKHYIKTNYPLSKNRSQEFILKLIFILYSKGYYELLLYDVLEYLDEDIKDSMEVKKIKAHVFGSSIIEEYKKAFDLLHSIYLNNKDKNNDEIIDMQTEAISNMRRYQLNDAKTDNNQKKKIIIKLVSHYEEIFNHNDTYHYYPGINLAYTIVVSLNLFGEKIKHNYSIETLYTKAKNSIKVDKHNINETARYYAHITEIEFMLLRNIGNSIAELEQFLDAQKQMISPIELERTQRQMQFFVDTVVDFGVQKNAIISNMQKAIEIIDDFIDYQSEIKQ